MVVCVRVRVSKRVHVCAQTQLTVDVAQMSAQVAQEEATYRQLQHMMQYIG